MSRLAETGVAFTWHGRGEMDDVCGRGHAQRKSDGTIAGHLDTHLGDRSGFKAHKE